MAYSTVHISLAFQTAPSAHSLVNIIVPKINKLKKHCHHYRTFVFSVCTVVNKYTDLLHTVMYIHSSILAVFKSSNGPSVSRPATLPSATFQSLTLQSVTQLSVTLLSVT